MSILIKIIKLSVQFLLFSLIVSQSVKANIAGSALVEPPTSFNYVYQSGKLIISWRWGIQGGGDEAFSVTTDQISAINYSPFPSPVCPGGCSSNEDAFEISVSEDNTSYRHLATVTDTRNYEFTPTNHSSFQFRIRVKQSSFSGSVYYSDYLYSPIFNNVGAVIVPKVDSVKVYPAGQYLVDGTKVSLQSDQTNEIYFKVSNEFDSCSTTEGWQLYSVPFALGYSAKICTSAKKQGWLDSDITSHSYTVLEQLAYPLMTPSGGTISSSSKITLNNTQYEKTGLYIQQRVYGAGVVQYKILNYQQSCDVSFWRTYIAPFKLNGSSRVCARVILEGQSSSSVSYKDFNLKLDYLTISPNGGNYSANTQFSISNPQSAAIKYKMVSVGSACSDSSWLNYTSAVTLTNSQRVCYKATKSNWTDSDIRYADFTLKFKLTSPAITPNGGQYSTNTQFSISNPQSAAIKYKMVSVGSACSDSSWLNYTSAVRLTNSQRVCYKATKSGWMDSNISYADFNFKLEKPSISPAVSEIIAGTLVTLSINNSDANLQYKLVQHGASCVNGAWLSYSTPVVLDSDAKLCAKATSLGWVDSDIEFNDYRIHQSEYADISNNSLADSAFSSVDAPLVESIGTIAGQAGVSGGAATYHIPIELPPGRAGMQPVVSLNYSSRSGNGIAGVGWSLSAGSNITRCAATYAQDSFTQNPQYNSNDRLCLDGQRLIATSGTYGNSGTEYRTEIDSFTRVTQSGSLNGTLTWFKAEYKNGRVAYFGKTADSRLVHGGKSASYSWLIEYQHDATAKNYIHYEYEEFGVGEKLLTDIYYTGASSDTRGNRYVSFSYINRSDRRTNYLAKGTFSSTKTLNEISTFYGNELVWRYGLSYQNSLSNQRSLLRDITQCNLFACLPKTEFSWLESQPQYSFEPLEFQSGNNTVEMLTQPYISKIIPRGDGNGDGVRDWPSVDINSDGSPEQLGLSANAEGEIINDQSDTLGYCFSPIGASGVRCLEGDFNLDGRSDAFSLSGGWGSNGLFKIKYAGSSSWINTEISRTHYSDELLAIDDFNGDGWPDIVVRQVDDGVKWRAKITIFFNTKNTSRPFTTANSQVLIADAVAGGNRGTVNYVDIQSLGDLDGNGTSDFILYQNSGLVPDIAIPDKVLFISPNNGGVSTITEYQFSGYLDVTSSNSVGEANLFHDVNGDGLLDWLAVDVDMTLAVRMNTGGDFDPVWQGLAVKLPMYQVGYLASTNEPETIYLPNLNFTFSMDYDGDGKQELLFAKDVVASACSQVENWRYSGGRQILATDWFCDNRLWSLIQGRYDAFNIRSVNGKELDVSARRYEAIYFDESNAGNITASIKATDIIASAGQKAAIDATGDGLVDVVTTFDCQRPNCKWNLETSSLSNGVKTDSSIENKPYINRNLGSFQGATKNAQGLYNYAAVDVMSAVSNGVGHLSDWQYKPLASDSFNDENGEFYSVTNHNSTTPYFNFSSSMLSVASFTQSNGIGGTREKQYKYRDAMYNAQGRGFMGFKSIIEEDVSRGLITQSDFKQVFPYQGKLTRQATFTHDDYVTRGDGLLGSAASESMALSYSNTEWRDNVNHSIAGVYSVYPRTTTQVTRDLSTKAELTRTNKNITGIDEYGNVTAASTQVADDWGTYSTSEVQVYDSNENNWWLNKLTSKTTTKASIANRHSSDPFTNAEFDKTTSLTTAYSNYHTSRQPQTVLISSQLAGSNSGYGSTVTTSYNAYGLPLSVSQTTKVRNSSGSWVDQTRSTSTTYSKNGTSEASDGYFPYKQINAKGHISYTNVSSATGQVTQTRQQLSGNNYQITNFTYDDYNRPYSVQTAGMPIQYTTVQAVDEDAPDYAVLQVLQVAAGQPTQKIYQDKLGRTLRTAVQGFNGDWVFTDVTYNTLGEKTFESVPYKAHATRYGSTYTHDVLGRVTNKITNQHCGDMTTEYDYNGLTTNLTVNEDCYGITLAMSRTYNSLKQLMQTVDANNGVTRYSYNNQGLPIIIQDANGNNIVAKYNALGQKTQVNDPNQGITNFQYNGFGELQYESRAGNKAVSYVTDVLGRVTRRTVTGENTLTYTYDGATYGLGQLNQATGNGVTKTYSYDNLGRPSSQTIAGSGKSYTTTTFYDSNYGRVKGLRYPNNLTLEYIYNDAGYQTQVKNAANGYVYKAIIEHDAFGNIAQSTLGNGLIENTAYSTKNGQMTLKTIAKNNSNIMSIDYSAYDGFGNLKAVDITTGSVGNQHSFSESYTYDALHRLESNAVNGITTIDYSYDAVGNLLSKSDYASQYDYENSTTGGPNAVKRIYRSGSWKTFAYDARGNMTQGDGLTSATYNAMDKPTQIIKSSKTLNFTYGPQHMRFKQVNGSVTTYYSDKLYEEEINGTKTTWRAYIDDIAVISQTTGEGATIRYTHRDRLGSARVFTDHNGQVEAERNFDPFGKPRLASGGLKSFGNSKLDDLNDAKTTRGFTDHEHLDNVELIHMNGRVYDYNLGRFMSADPVIQSPTNSQSINPYSYIMNNPLSGTDPTGYASCSADDAASCQEVAENLEKGETADITQKQSVTGSRIKRDVKVGTMTGNGNGTVNIQIGNMSATADIGAPSSTSKGTGGVAGGYIDQQKANRGQALGEFGANLDDDIAALNHDPSDWGQTAMSYSNLYVGKHDTEALLAGKLTQADLYDRAEMYGTVASFVPIGYGARVAYGSYQLLRLRSAFSVAPAKFDYFFGRVVTGNAKNIARSAQNLKDLTTLGVKSEKQLSALFREAFYKGRITGTQTNQYGTSVMRSVQLGNRGEVNVSFFYKAGNMNAQPTVSTIIPKIYK
ncbi:SpvB/TcaC N-terminal domain-containing protein [Pseudoalteromonas rhizosphaerae]|uniref:SpvB/TcaC N-terminal domain-containing protein n=1 Tax=Pseudoalteromonas rhizosphaerae TaxID=2518973 RepID=UPI00384F9D09